MKKITRSFQDDIEKKMNEMDEKIIQFYHLLLEGGNDLALLKTSPTNFEKPFNNDLLFMNRSNNRSTSIISFNNLLKLPKKYPT